MTDTITAEQKTAASKYIADVKGRIDGLVESDVRFLLLMLLTFLSSEYPRVFTHFQAEVESMYGESKLSREER